MQVAFSGKFSVEFDPKLIQFLVGDSSLEKKSCDILFNGEP